jgi:fructan beta-fructosidase
MKYNANPVISSGLKLNTRDTRDPKVFWHKATGEWVMILFERDGNSIYTSHNLREWNYESHVKGFWECPEMFELAVDNDPNNTRWVMYGGSGTYIIGSFDGKKFTPQTGKHYYCTGSLFAAQTYNDITDGRRIQIGWGKIQNTGMPFNQMMLLPTELTLRTTPNGIRLYCAPVKEIDKLQGEGIKRTGLTVEEANSILKDYETAECLRIKTTISPTHSSSAGLKAAGQDIINYDMNYNKINGVFYTNPTMTGIELNAEIFIDLTSVEVFIDGGTYSYSFERKRGDKNGFQFFSSHPAEITNLEIYPMKSIWR